MTQKKRKIILVMPWHAFCELRKQRPDLPWSKLDRWYDTFEQAQPMIVFYKIGGYHVHLVFDCEGLQGLHEDQF